MELEQANFSIVVPKSFEASNLAALGTRLISWPWFIICGVTDVAEDAALVPLGCVEIFGGLVWEEEAGVCEIVLRLELVRLDVFGLEVVIISILVEKRC